MSDMNDVQVSNEVQETLSKIYHDLNNPLSIISGNAQFLLEISRDEDVSEQFVSSVQDIKEAAERMSEALRELTELKEES